MAVTRHVRNPLDTTTINPVLYIRTGRTFPLSDGLSVQGALAPSLMRTSDVVGRVGWTLKDVYLRLLTGLRMNDLATGGAWAGADADVDIGTGNALTLALRHQSQTWSALSGLCTRVSSDTLALAVLCIQC